MDVHCNNETFLFPLFLIISKLSLISAKLFMPVEIIRGSLVLDAINNNSCFKFSEEAIFIAFTPRL